MTTRHLFIGLIALIVLAGSFNLWMGRRPAGPAVLAPTSGETANAAAPRWATRPLEASAGQPLIEHRARLQAHLARLERDERLRMPLDKAGDLRQAVLRHYARTSTWPTEFADIGVDPARWNRARDRYELGAAGRIRIRFGAPYPDGSALTLAPESDHGLIVWRCSLLGSPDFEADLRRLLRERSQPICRL